MDELNYRLNLLDNRLIKLTTLIENLVSKEQKDSPMSKQKLYSLRDAVQMKYGDSVSYSTVSTNIYLQPCVGQAYKISAGKKLWNYEQMQEYLASSDQDVPDLCRKYGVPLVGRLGEKYKKYDKGGDK